MNAVYLHKPRHVALFNINYRTQTERSTIKGLRIGAASRRPHGKNIVLVSGLPMQDPSTIGVNLYVAAMLSRMQPMFPYDISMIPLAHPREYEKQWRKMEPMTPQLYPSMPIPVAPKEEAFPGAIVEETMSLELKDSCKPIEAYVTRRNKYYVNVQVDMSAHGSAMQYKSNSLSALASKGKHYDFFRPSPTPTPTHPHLGLIPDALAGPRIYGGDSLLSPMLQTPTFVLELRSTQALDDAQVAARGEEVIAMMQELVA